ncbi:unnamed protein product [Microthlaspi erraticum]|uniref:Prolamin-like domain-containing protein n=1 Tax=Microthlaspi erraticum TaxID=1685480 RepID=A0A6D2HHI4_9BRAS|nr:unnamed protein product [Microthlaspi erraticum]
MKKAILITFLVATSMAYNQALAQEEYDEISPSPQEYLDVTAAVNYDHELIQHMTPQHLGFLRACTEKLLSKCGIEIPEGLVKDKPVSVECCENMMNIGIDCHKGLMDFVFTTYELKDVASEFLPKSKRIWNQCVQTTASRIGAPVAFET